MKKFSPFMAPVMMFNGELYRDVAANWGGLGFWFLFVVVMLSWTLQTVRSSMEVAKQVTDNRQSFNASVKDLPHIKIEGGQMTIDKPSPYVFKVGGNAFILFDTNNKITTLAAANEWLLSQAKTPLETEVTKEMELPYMLANSDKLLMKGQDRSRPPQEVLMSQLKSMELSPEIISQIMDAVPAYWVGGCILIGLIAVFPVHLLIALVYGIVAVIMASLTGGKIDFGAGMRLAVVAMTPAIVLAGLAGTLNGGVMGAFNAYFPIMNIASVPITLGFLYFACAQATAPQPDK